MLDLFLTHTWVSFLWGLLSTVSDRYFGLCIPFPDMQLCEQACLEDRVSWHICLKLLGSLEEWEVKCQHSLGVPGLILPWTAHVNVCVLYCQLNFEQVKCLWRCSVSSKNAQCSPSFACNSLSELTVLPWRVSVGLFHLGEQFCIIQQHHELISCWNDTGNQGGFICLIAQCLKQYLLAL